MFHWICPECGQEIAPGVKECPVCEPQITTTPASTVTEPAVKQPVVELPEAQGVLQPEIILRPEVVLQPQAYTPPKTPAVLNEIAAEARPVVMPDVPVGTAPVELPDRLVERPPQTETFADRLADLADLLHAERVPYTAPRVFQESAAPGPRIAADAEKTPIILDVTFSGDVKFHAEVTPNGMPVRQLLAAPPSLLLLTEPQAPSIARDFPIQAFNPRPAAYTVRTQKPLGTEAAAASPVQLPDPPNRGVAPALAPFQDYYKAADRQMRPAEFVTPTAEAKALPRITLPGPALPRELMSLQAAGLVPIRVGGRRASLSGGGGLMKYVVVGILLTAGVATYSMIPGSSTSAPPRPTPEPAPEPPVSVQSTHSTNSLARFVEVTGVRFMEVNKKPQIHYLVVNHSNAPLNSMTVYVTLRASDAKPGQPPIAKLTFRSPALAAFEAKEMFSSIEHAVGPLDLPDWQDLRADVEVQ
jgi:hypothetical protein